jgi:anti-sigma regulatory factor (Ser/Thr protein kinase)
MSSEVRHRFPHGPTAPAAAREAVDAAFGQSVDREALPDLRLLVSELVTNAVRHGEDRRGAVELALSCDGNRLRVEVGDGGHGFVPRTRSANPHETGGWGLVVVDRLADRWGVSEAGGTLVWFEVNV